MNHFDFFGGNLRRPEATLKRRLPQVNAQEISNLQRNEATEATLLKVLRVGKGKSASLLYIEGVGKRLPRLPQLSASACLSTGKVEATSKTRLPQVASEVVR